MNLIKTDLPGVILIKLEKFKDTRGYFFESFQKKRYLDAGINPEFVQDNISVSNYGVIRGLHYQTKRPQGKLVSCLKGKVFDVVADINPSSTSFGKYIGIELSEKNSLQLWIPPGYAHGFCSLSDEAYFHYKCTEFYDPSSERGVLWNDSTLNINWPVDSPIVSAKDQILPELNEQS